jgi:hypothetical protein
MSLDCLGQRKDPGGIVFYFGVAIKSRPQAIDKRKVEVKEKDKQSDSPIPELNTIELAGGIHKELPCKG